MSVGELHVVTEVVNGRKRVLKVCGSSYEAREFIDDQGAKEKKFTDHGIVDRKDVMAAIRSLEDK